MSQLSSAGANRQLNNRQYRSWYLQERLPRFYHPLFHVFFNLLVLTTLIAGHLLFIQDYNWAVAATCLLTFLLGNVAVFVIHKYPLHHRLKWWPYPYDTHTIEHHRYFTSEFNTWDHLWDLRAIFFPSSMVAGFALVAQPLLYFSTAAILGRDMAHAFAATGALYFLLYEFVHFCSHLKSDHWLMRISWLRYMRQHHQIHHHPRLMNKYNFCIVYPLMDIIMGTKYRGPSLQENQDDHYNDVSQYIK